MSNNSRSVIIILGVIGLVLAVAWYRNSGSGAHAGAPLSRAHAGLPRVVDFGSDKCAACKQMAPILVELQKEFAGRASVEFVDVLKNPAAGEPYDIRVLPTQVFFDASGKEIWRNEGALPKADIAAKFAEMGVK